MMETTSPGASSRARGLILSSGYKLLPFFLLFLYFLTSSGELLHIVISIFKPKVAHVVAMMFFGYFCWTYRKIILPRPILYPFLWILASQCISVFFSPHPVRACGYITIYLFSFIFYFLIPMNLFQVFQPSKVLKTYFLAFCCIGLYAVFQMIFSIFGLYDPFAFQTVGSFLARGQAWTYEPSFYALYITAFVMFKNATAIFRPVGGFSKKEILKLLGINFFLMVSTSTGLIFSYPVFCLVSLWASLLKPLRTSASYVKWRIFKFVAFCCVIGGVLSFLFWDIFKWSYFKFFYLGFQNHGSFTVRWEGIVSCFRIFLEYPLFGIGIGGVGPYLFERNSFYEVKPQNLPDVEAYDPTNVLSEILASLGIVGFIGFVLLSWAFYRCFLQFLGNPKISQSDRNTGIALFISLIVMLIVLQFNQGLFRPYIWIHSGIVYGYLHRLRTVS